MESIAEIIRDLRSLGMTQKEVAVATGLSQAYISGIERGGRGSRTPASTLNHVKAVRDELCKVKTNPDSP